jgi:hypothetical protein
MDRLAGGLKREVDLKTEHNPLWEQARSHRFCVCQFL